MIGKFLLALSFFTRLPIGKHDLGALNLSQSAAWFPVAGAITGLISGIIYLAFLHMGINGSISAWITIFFQLILTGGLHEDGLADMADGLASGRSKEQKLAIMRDSRIGSYGVLALICILSLRANIISGFNSGHSTLLIFIAAACASRAFLTIFMHKLPFARSDGLAAMADRPGLSQTLTACTIGTISLFLAGKAMVAVTALVALATIYFTIKTVALRNFGGITGDVLGAAQQISETTLLLILLIA